MGALKKMLGFGSSQPQMQTINPVQQNVTNDDIALNNDVLTNKRRAKAGADTLNTANGSIAGSAASGDKREVTGA